MSKRAVQYGVNPELALGVGGESTFGSGGTYRRTGDAFGMTGGSTRHMTHAGTPDQNAQQFFDNYGSQIRGSGDNVGQFTNALLGMDTQGRPVRGWKRYNSKNLEYPVLLKGWIHQMQRDVPIYQQGRPGPQKGANPR